MKFEQDEVLLFFTFAVIRQISARHNLDDLSEHLNNRNIDSRNPLIVIVNPQHVDDKEVMEFKNDVIDYPKDLAKSLLYNYLLRSDPGSKGTKEEKNKESLLAALRSKCQARVECEEKCDEEVNIRNKYCPVNCKAVFDKLNLCEPPKPKKKIISCDSEEERDQCGKKSKTGRTMPPSWRALA